MEKLACRKWLLPPLAVYGRAGVTRPDGYSHGANVMGWSLRLFDAGRHALNIMKCPSDLPNGSSNATRGDANYGFSSGSTTRVGNGLDTAPWACNSINCNGFTHRGRVSDNSDANRTKQYLNGFSFEEFTDGLSKTIMASEILTGTGDNSEQLYPRNAAQRVAASVPNNQRSFISASQLDTFGQALAASGT